MHLAARATTLPGDPGRWDRGEPLWKLAPKRDADGRPYTDFMMLAPRLNQRPAAEIEALTHIIRDVLTRHEEWVVFADLNLKCNVLWVSLKHQPGVMARIITALRARAPEFKLVAHQPTQPG
ncbi:MAG: hypothetical protein FD187_1398 [bacterium]|nr:MAG: hypothetical protein FD142_2323 [bacterium]KAF0149039.1 MAG: hypothetical protein FD187_1398 [bacterium]KAF0168469.1 MAG: hypothetical protein FD158_1380 [bacterium]TXT20781.1 MAG: hypothetical protein FD132_1013 [bacterium]